MKVIEVAHPIAFLANAKADEVTNDGAGRRNLSLSFFLSSCERVCDCGIDVTSRIDPSVSETLGWTNHDSRGPRRSLTSSSPGVVMREGTQRLHPSTTSLLDASIYIL